MVTISRTMTGTSLYFSSKLSLRRFGMFATMIIPLFVACMSTNKKSSRTTSSSDGPLIAPVLEPVANSFFFLTRGALQFDAQAPTYSKEAKGQYAEVNGIKMYYEVTGSGEPLILLHGGFYNMDYWAAYQVPEFSKKYKVITVDSRGHGRTTDGPGPITYDVMTEDVFQLMKYLKIESAHFVGWSDGGIIGMNMAIAHPERVKKLVLDGASTQFSGAVSTVNELGMSSENVLYLLTTLGCSDAYKKINPEPSHWPEFVVKMRNLWESDCYLNHESDQECMAPLKRIASKTLILVGESDLILASHTNKIKDHVQNSKLIVIPDADHFVAREQPKAFNGAVLDFLGTNLPRTKPSPSGESALPDDVITRTSERGSPGKKSELR